MGHPPRCRKRSSRPRRMATKRQVTSGKASTTALEGSTEAAQFHAAPFRTRPRSSARGSRLRPRHRKVWGNEAPALRRHRLLRRGAAGNHKRQSVNNGARRVNGSGAVPRGRSEVERETKRAGGGRLRLRHCKVWRAGKAGLRKSQPHFVFLIGR